MADLRDLERALPGSRPGTFVAVWKVVRHGRQLLDLSSLPAPPDYFGVYRGSAPQARATLERWLASSSHGDRFWRVLHDHTELSPDEHTLADQLRTTGRDLADLVDLPPAMLQSVLEPRFGLDDDLTDAPPSLFSELDRACGSSSIASYMLGATLHFAHYVTAEIERALSA